MTAVAAVALALRVYLLTRWELQVDESFTWQLSRLPVWDVLQRSAHDVHPPMHYLTLKAWCGIFGPSLTAARALSVAFGVLSTLFGYLLLLEGLRLEGAHGNADSAPQTASRPAPYRASIAWQRAAAAMFALLLATHFLHVHYGRDVRMYSQGIFLAVFTSWLLLHEQNQPSRRNWFSPAYGVAAAAFLYTHSLAVLTLMSQLIFVLVDGWVRRRTSTDWRFVKRVLAGAALAATLFSPWLPVLWFQTSRVYENYWISQLDLSTFTLALARLTVGIQNPAGDWWVGDWQTIALLAVCWLALGVLARPTRVKLFFLMQFAIPWIVAVDVSLLSSRPIFLERTLLFSHVSLLALFSVQLARSRSWWLRVSLLALLVPTGMGAASYLSRLPALQPTMTAVVRVLKGRNQPGDVLVVRRHNDLFRYHCQARQAGLSRLPARSPFSPFHTGDYLEMMALALNGEDVVEDHLRVPPGYRRMWLLSPSGDTAMSGYHVDRIESIRFRGQTDYTLELYVAGTGDD